MKALRALCRPVLLAALAAALLFTGCAGIMPAPDAGYERPTAGKALVVFYREPRGFGRGLGFKVNDGFTLIGGLRNGNYFTYQADPGLHFFTASTETQAVRPLTVAAGRTYNLRCSMRPGFVYPRVGMKPVSSAEGRAAVQGLQKVAKR